VKLFNKVEVEFRFVWARTVYWGGNAVFAGAGARNGGDFLGKFGEKRMKVEGRSMKDEG
jgi:hypothetical protein